MAMPVEICVEDLDRAPEDERYIHCVALPGGEPGLALDRKGDVRWMPEEPADYALWVSEDDRLVLLRGEGVGPVTVSRSGRSVQAPVGRPVVLLDQDLLLFNGRQLRIHIHGLAEQIHEPEPLGRSALARMARAAATAVALGAAVAAGSSATATPATAPIEVRVRPPSPPEPVVRVACKITKMARSKAGPLMVHALCPSPSSVQAGTHGEIVDAKGTPIANGTVVVKKVAGTKVVAQSKLTKPVKATQVVFRTYR